MRFTPASRRSSAAISMTGGSGIPTPFEIGADEFGANRLEPSRRRSGAVVVEISVRVWKQPARATPRPSADTAARFPLPEEGYPMPQPLQAVAAQVVVADVRRGRDYSFEEGLLAVRSVELALPLEA